MRRPTVFALPPVPTPGRDLVALGVSEHVEDADSRVREEEGEQHLRDLNYQVVRWLGKEIYLRPDVVMARVARTLEG